MQGNEKNQKKLCASQIHLPCFHSEEQDLKQSHQIQFLFGETTKRMQMQCNCTYILKNGVKTVWKHNFIQLFHSFSLFLRNGHKLVYWYISCCLTSFFFHFSLFLSFVNVCISTYVLLLRLLRFVQFSALFFLFFLIFEISSLN